MRRTADGCYSPLRSWHGAGDDGFPVLSIGRRVSNDEVLMAIEKERADR